MHIIFNNIQPRHWTSNMSWLNVVKNFVDEVAYCSTSQTKVLTKNMQSQYNHDCYLVSYYIF